MPWAKLRDDLRNGSPQFIYGNWATCSTMEIELHAQQSPYEELERNISQFPIPERPMLLQIARLSCDSLNTWGDHVLSFLWQLLSSKSTFPSSSAKVTGCLLYKNSSQLLLIFLFVILSLSQISEFPWLLSCHINFISCVKVLYRKRLILNIYMYVLRLWSLLITEVKDKRADQSEQWFTSFSMHQNILRGLIKHKLLGTTPRVSDSAGIGKVPQHLHF